MNPSRLFVSLLCGVLAGGAQAASSPKALAQAVQSALDRGDFAAARALADLDAAPAELHFFYFDQVRECADDSRCTVAVAPLDSEFRQQLAEQAAQEKAELPPIEGLVTVTAKAKDGSSSGTMKMPYARIGKDCRIVALRLSPAEIARRRAITGEQMLREMFAGGIHDAALGTRRTDWEKVATRLPADGGEAGAALVAQTRAMAAAADARDPDAAARSGGRIAALIYADKDYDGKPVPLEARRRKLQVQSLRLLREVKIGGGYRFGDDAALVIEARDGIGWIERGAVLMSREGGEWVVSGRQLTTFPAD
jgi:hypothetical protein